MFYLKSFACSGRSTAKSPKERPSSSGGVSRKLAYIGHDLK